MHLRGGELVRLGRRFSLIHPRVLSGSVAAPHLPAALRSALRAADFPGYLLSDVAPERQRARPRGERARR
jgi:hypothetical protein